MSVSTKNATEKWVKFDDAESDDEFVNLTKKGQETNQEFNNFAQKRLNETQEFNEFTQRRLDKYGEIFTLDKSSPEASKKWSLSIDRSPITGWSEEILTKRN